MIRTDQPLTYHQKKRLHDQERLWLASITFLLVGIIFGIVFTKICSPNFILGFYIICFLGLVYLFWKIAFLNDLERQEDLEFQVKCREETLEKQIKILNEE